MSLAVLGIAFSGIVHYFLLNTCIIIKNICHRFAWCDKNSNAGTAVEETVIPYELPDRTNHSFFFVDVRIPPAEEAKLHRHDAWELLYVIHGCGNRTVGDAVQPFTAGDLVLIPPSMTHQWAFAPDSGDENGHIHYLMAAFSHTFVEQCQKTFPELRNRLVDIFFPVNALQFGVESARVLGSRLMQMCGEDELGRLCEMLRLLSDIFTTSDHTLAGRPVHIERNVQRMQQICTYVMRHYAHPITLNDISIEIGMNRSAFCTCFKHFNGMTFLQFLTEYRINTACELLKSSSKQISEICYLVGFNDLPHFVRVFKHKTGVTPSYYRKIQLNR